MPPQAAPSVAAPSRVKAKGPRTRAVLVGVEPPAPVELLESKLCIPELRAEVVSRTGLVNRLRAERARIVTVVAAAGYGKTTLLAQWAARDERPFAWLSIDDHDNDARTLLRHLAAAFERVEPVDPAVFAALASPTPSVWTSAVPRLAASLASCSRPFVLVLDNVELLRRGDAADAVLALAKSVPEGSLLALAGRASPPLPIARLRTAGWLLELDATDLALGHREAHLLVRGVGNKLDDEQAADLARRTEGWAAGLHLAALALDPSDHAPERFISQYFHSEHLSRLKPERLAFLRQTSVLERLCGPLCDAALDARGSADELEAIERANLFLVPLDRSGAWYRYHGLFRDVLRSELERHEPELVPVLHGRAADWFESQGELEPALDHALAAGDTVRAARLFAAIALPVYYSGRIATVEGWLDGLAAAAPLDEHPAVAVIGGWVHALRGRAAEAERWLQAAEAAEASATLPDGTSVRPWTALLRAGLCAHGVGRMRRDVEAALAELPAESAWVPTALALEGAVALLSGDSALADQRFASAADAADRLGATDTRLVAIAQRSLLAAAAGDHRAAERLALEARELLATSPVADYATTAIVHAAAARVFLRRGRWDDARRELTAAKGSTGVLTHALPWFAVETRLALAGAYVMLRDRSAASAELVEIEKIVALRPHLGVHGAQIDDLNQQLAELPDGLDGRNAGLTAAELRLLPLLATHLSFREIGEHLFVSRNTIKTQAISAYRKLGVSSRSSAIERAAELGLVDDAATNPVEFIRTG